MYNGVRILVQFSHKLPCLRFLSSPGREPGQRDVVLWENGCIYDILVLTAWET